MSIGMINADDLIAYCEKAADINKELLDRAYDSVVKGGSDTLLTAIAWFTQQENMYRYDIPNIIRGFTDEQKQSFTDNAGCKSDTE